MHDVTYSQQNPDSSEGGAELLKARSFTNLRMMWVALRPKFPIVLTTKGEKVHCSWRCRRLNWSRLRDSTLETNEAEVTVAKELESCNS
jgi:hypothetical protein